jgi:selenocysteine lyase/cysteine desulfurase
MLGTFELNGTVRVSPGLFTAEEEIDAFLNAIREIVEEA